MSTILWLGARFFHRDIADSEVRLLEFHRPRVLTWERIVREAGFEPEVLVFGDNSCPPALSGVHRFPCLTVFYAVDTHIHSWLPDYGQAFDLCLVSLKDHVDLFEKRLPRERLLWSPPYARDKDRPLDAETEWDVLFVGNVDPAVTPKRHEMLVELGKRVPLKVTKGKYFELYPRARVVLNEAWRGDLNFRVFEALGCGTCLVTPRVGHGLTDLFEDGRDLFLYDRGDLDGLADLLRRLLADPEKRRRAAASGLAKIDAGHRMKHRARTFENFLSRFDHARLVEERLDHAANIFETRLRWLYLHWAEAVADAELKSAYLAASRSV
jgi:hypothetical protein